MLVQKENSFLTLGVGGPARRGDHEVHGAVAHAARLEQAELAKGVLGADVAANGLGHGESDFGVGDAALVDAVGDVLDGAAEDELGLADQVDEVHFPIEGGGMRGGWREPYSEKHADEGLYRA